MRSWPTKSGKLTTDSERLWQELIAAEEAAGVAQEQFLQCDERVEIVRQHIFRKRGTALNVIRRFNREEKKALLPELVCLIPSHRSGRACREIIISIGRPWLVENVEAFVEPHLQEADEQEYRGYLSLYEAIDPMLAIKLALRAMKHPDNDVQEAGREVYEDLTQHQPAPAD